jgi:hypothetical protein
MPTKFEAFLVILKQPSTIKGILGIATIISVRFGLKDFLTPEDFSTVVEGIATIYFAIAIFWQKS